MRIKWQTSTTDSANVLPYFQVGDAGEHCDYKAMVTKFSELKWNSSISAKGPFEICVFSEEYEAEREAKNSCEDALDNGLKLKKKYQEIFESLDIVDGLMQGSDVIHIGE